MEGLLLKPGSDTENPTSVVFASQRPTERWLQHGQLLELDLAPGTVADGLRRWEPLFQPLQEALCERNRQSVLTQGDETRWLV